MAYTRWSSSNWYIFWHTNEACHGRKQYRNDQYLAMWYAGLDNHPVMPYSIVKQMYESDDWRLMGHEIQDKQTLREHVKLWLDDVDQEYPR